MSFWSKIVGWFFKSKEETAEEKREAVYLPDANRKGQPKRQGRPELQKQERERKERTERNGQRSQRQNNERKERQGQERKERTPRQNKERQELNVHDVAERTAKRKQRNVDMTGWVAPTAVRENENDVMFQDLTLEPRILRALVEDLQFKKCSPIQAKALPEALKGQDLAGRAQTGTGKTATFLITVLQHFLNEKQGAREPWQPMSIILAPTRELAIQIAKDAEAISAYCGEFHVVAVFGGMDFDKQMSDIAKGVDLVVATPGRLIDFLGRGAVDLSKVEIVVIDEADRMLDMGFIPDVKRIMSRLPEASKRQTMLFSATLSYDIMQLASRWMRPNPVVIEIEPEHVVAEGISETVYAVTTAEKMSVLLWILNNEDCRRVLIFRNRRTDVENLHSALVRCGIECEMLTGDVDQKKRLRILDDFRDGKIRIIVATDVAGRGIHVDDVTHVINYDFPYEAEDYVHRVGRTARAGHKGSAISFADEDSAFVIPDIEKYIERALPITQPAEEMLTFGGKQRGGISTRSTGSRGLARNNNYGNHNYHPRNRGNR